MSYIERGISCNAQEYKVDKMKEMEKLSAFLSA